MSKTIQFPSIKRNTFHRNKSDDKLGRAKSENGTSSRHHVNRNITYPSDVMARIPDANYDQFSWLTYRAVMAGDLPAVRAIFGRATVMLVDREGNTPLHLAAKKGDSHILR